MQRILFIFEFFITLSASSDVCYDKISNSSEAVTALILARGGSKGIKLKNIQRIDGVTLLGISLTELQQANKFDTIWVSTDHQDIADEAEKCLNIYFETSSLKLIWHFLFSDNVNVHWRDPQTALDGTSSIESVQEFLNYHPNVAKLALIQCTSPFINQKYIRRGIKKFSNHHCVFSVKRSFNLRWKFDKKSKRIFPINFEINKRPRRQDWSGELVEAGMFYMSSVGLLKRGLFQNERRMRRCCHKIRRFLGN
ncbi:CLUMA_CG007677, isoform A [Clunio marinus]|uniref:CLUMA_CG007677, isoform A n=1 Tax=Clunio marinus TaxID=568069 RepID=A0A1J1I5G1_9DIPT|nr:CLUMA_CG007677, isoform A [Clunio marinus]